MAENKKSFVLYADLVHTVKKMPNDKAGELLKVILSYVNDENPIVEDILVDLVFEPIKRQMKRDLEKWDKKISKYSESGSKGGKKSGETRRRKALENEAKRSDASKNEANEAVTANVNVTATVISLAGGLDFNSIFENLRMATNRKYITDEQVKQEAQTFKKKYDGMNIKNLKSLCNTWAGNMIPWQSEVKKMQQ